MNISVRMVTHGMNRRYGRFVAEDVEKILSLKITSKAGNDLLGWSYNENVIYSVKSGYWLFTHLPYIEDIQPVFGNVLIKQKIWKTKTPPKIKLFFCMKHFI